MVVNNYTITQGETMRLLILLTFIALNASASKLAENCHYELRSTGEVDFCTQGGCRDKMKKVLVCIEYNCSPTRVVYDNSKPSGNYAEDDCRSEGPGACM